MNAIMSPAVKWRKWLRIIHRDGGYLFTGALLIYAVSGIALNHREDWNPNFIVERREVSLRLPADRNLMNREWVLGQLNSLGIRETYRTHDFPSPGKMKIFLKNGSLLADAETGGAEYESLRRRPVFYYINRLHLNPNRWWTVYSDIFCGALVLIGGTGLFLARGKHGFIWRRAILTAAGCLIPAVFIFVLD